MAAVVHNLTVGVAPVFMATDEDILNALTTLVNKAYDRGEKGMWHGAPPRTNPTELAELIRGRKLIIATVNGGLGTPASMDDVSIVVVVGCVALREVGEKKVSFGMLAVVEDQVGKGIGNLLIEEVESVVKSDRFPGRNVLGCELLEPVVGVEHGMKKRLRDWYMRLGYLPVPGDFFEEDFVSSHSDLLPLLVHKCTFTHFEKKLV